MELSGPNAKGGKIYPGYVVGCQVNIDGGAASGGVDGASSWDGEKVSVGAKSGADLTLGPGQATSFYLLDLEEADAFGSESHQKRIKFSGSSGSVTWADSTIGLSGCAGLRAGAGLRQGEGVDRERELGGHPVGAGRSASAEISPPRADQMSSVGRSRSAVVRSPSMVTTIP